VTLYQNLAYMRNCSVKLISAFLLLLSLFSCNSCDKDTDKDSVIDSKDKCPNTPSGTKVDEKGCPVIEKKISKVVFYFDASESNAGYYYSGSKFNSVIAPLIQKSSNVYKTFINNISDEGIVPKGEGKQAVSAFIQNLGVDNPIVGKSSTIDKFFGSVMRRTDSSTISVLISDCILSYPDSIMGKDKTHNKNKNDAEGNIFKTNVITSISEDFDETKKLDYHPAFCVYAFVSDFFGKYFNCQNFALKQKVKLKNRPYYIWILSKDQKILNDFQKNVLDACVDFKPSEKLHFGLTKNEFQQYTIQPKLKRYGKFSPDNSVNGIRRIVLDERNKKVTFTLSVDLPNLNEISLVELNKNLEKKSNSNIRFEVKFLDKDSVTDDEKSKLGTNELKQKFNTSSHLLQITINEMLVEEDTLYITMPFKYPTWYQNWWTHDDTDLKNIESKTFAIDQIIMAFIETIQDDKKNIINIKIPVKK